MVWLTWIEQCLIVGDEKGVAAAKEQMKRRFQCEDVGLLTENVGCKIYWNYYSIKSDLLN